ncbi:hypothetical protein EGN72_10390 [Pseudorhodobacter sp. E13]|uniref:DUF6455 family protein n=1 Tax=Pseudorhodobacter sp. E13 TaxID=2487931 RepID=UPI000F8ED63A|nr:DUF6455 family protein [Pseudorhodobacter sp. E13]RUS60193.1 hypothetical protein EGN72_10390 [Pseudorhodobacter sp. E13]
MFDAVKETVARWRAQAQVEAMSDRECADLGVGRDTLRRHAGMPPTVEARMSQMAAVQGVDMSRLRHDRDSYLEAVETCDSCGVTKRCKSFLARPDSPAAEAAFCPNSTLYSQPALARTASVKD